jgi:hypothetical protein
MLCTNYVTYKMLCIKVLYIKNVMYKKAMYKMLCNNFEIINFVTYKPFYVLILNYKRCYQSWARTFFRPSHWCFHAQGCNCSHWRF